MPVEDVVLPTDTGARVDAQAPSDVQDMDTAVLDAQMVDVLADRSMDAAIDEDAGDGAPVDSAPDSMPDALCAPGEARCAATGLREVCSADGTQFVPAPCPMGQLCVGGVCTVRLCTPGSSRCAGPLSVETCAADGRSYGTPEPCLPGFGCNPMSNTCAPFVCTPGSTPRCDSITARALCNADGQGFSPAPCAPNESCSMGTCRPRVCMPGATRCAGIGSVETCAIDGLSWSSAACASNESCSAGACRMRICTPGATRCAGIGTVETCAADGLSWTSAACASNESCSAGACRPRICTPGATRCAGIGTVETCAVDGLSWSSAACASNESCSMGACRPRICTPGATRCAGLGTVETCAADGLSWTSAACAAGTGCTAGACRNPQFLILNAGAGTNPKRWCVSPTAAPGSWTCGTVGSSGDTSNFVWPGPSVANGRYWVGTNDQRLWQSSDGMTWTVAATLSHQVMKVAYRSGQYLAISGTTAASISSDGTTWTRVTLPFAAPGISSTSIRWVLSGETGERRLLTSTDGMTFTIVDPGVSSPRTPQITRCADGTLYLAHLAASYSELFRSSDGVSWTRVTITSGPLSAMHNHPFLCHGSTLVLWGDDGGYRFFRRQSTDGGQSWTRSTVYDGYRPTWPIAHGSAWDPISNTLLAIGAYYGDNHQNEAMNAYYLASGVTGALSRETIASNPFVAGGYNSRTPASILEE